MAKKQPVVKPRTNDSKAVSQAVQSPQQVQGASSFTTSEGREVTHQVAQDLAKWRLRLIPLSVARRVWNELFSTADRAKLGGDLLGAWQGDGRGTMAMYMRARNVTYERAMLEIAWGLAQIHEADYQRLLAAIGGQAAASLKPAWDPDRLRLTVGDQVCRTVRSRTVAINICSILDAFEGQSWAARIADPLPGRKDGQRLSKAIEKRNVGLERIRFRADGTGSGIIWEFV